MALRMQLSDDDIPFCGKTPIRKHFAGRRSLQDEILENHESSHDKNTRRLSTVSLDLSLDKNDTENSLSRNESYDWKMSVGYLEAMKKLDTMKDETVRMHQLLSTMAQDFASIRKNVRSLKKEMRINKEQTTEFYHEMEVEAYLSDMIRKLDRYGNNIHLEMYPLGFDVNRDMRMPHRDFWPRGAVGQCQIKAVLKSHSDTVLK